MGKLTQKERVASLVIDICILLVICLIAFDSIYPPIGDKGFWFYTALLSVLVGSKLVTPFYVKPADAISYAVPSFVALMLVNNWKNWNGEVKIAFVFVVALSLIVLISALLSIILNNWKDEKLQEISNKTRLFLEAFGRPQVIYTPIIVFAMYTYHKNAPNELILITIALILTVTISLGDIVLITYKRLLKNTKVAKNILSVAEVVAYQQPHIVLLRQAIDEKLPLKKFVYIKD
nr:hypothetical protein [Deltaproteobacteria bacterium]